MTDFEELEKLGIPSHVIREILESGVKAIILKDGLRGADRSLTLAQHRPALHVIEINRSIDCEKACGEIRKNLDIDLSPGEVFLWLLFHEWMHFRGVKGEAQADLFASQEISRRRGYKKTFSITVNIDLNKMAERIKEAVREGLR